MNRIVLLLVCLMLPVAIASPIQGVAKLGDPSSFDQWSVLDRVFPGFDTDANFALQGADAIAASRTGLIDFSVTDSLLNFYDDYIMTSLLARDLRSYLIAFDFGEMPDLREPAIIVYEEE